jgi:hypothetical protein
MKQKELKSIIIFSYVYFISFSFSLFFLFPLFFFFSLLFFSSHHFFIFHFFSFAPQNFLKHKTYIAFVRDDVMTPPLCLNDARPQA